VTPNDTHDGPLPAGLAQRLRQMFPESRVRSARHLGTGETKAEGETTKGLGYGRPIVVVLALPDGREQRLVFHTASPDDFGHDRRSDRVAEMLLAWDTFSLLPRHVRALDVGVLAADGALVPLGGAGEGYLVTEWAEGTLYAADLRRIAESGEVTDEDVARAERLARLLVAIHKLPGTHEGAYVRAWRDTVGGGEGIAGMVDGYPRDTPGAASERLAAIERACLGARQRHKAKTSRLRRTHGDFHPFNLLFDARGEPVLLDTSRGSEGEPADDVACLAINYLFFGVEHRATWRRGLGTLWQRFFGVYLAESGDRQLLDVIAPFFAWRGLVVASPRWYPNLAASDRSRILGFVERALAAERFDPALGLEVMS
jgi:hypothetical protein